MTLDTSRYPTRYATAEARALYLTAMNGYGSIGNMALDLGFRRTFFAQCAAQGLPEKYAGYLGRKWGFSPALLAYEDYLTLASNTVKAVLDYEELLRSSQFFTQEDKKYILGGAYIKDASKWVRQQDKSLAANRRAA